MNLSSVKLTGGEVKTLLLGLSFAPTPRSDIFNLERDIYLFSRKIRLKFHFAGKTNPDKSLVRIPSTWTPARNKNQELEHILKPVENMDVGSRKVVDNISNNRNDLKLLIEKTKKNEIVIKPADKGDIIVIQNAEDYRNMCCDHLENPEYFTDHGDQDPSDTIHERVKNFATKYGSMLTQKESEFLQHDEHKMSNFYCLPKLHKHRELNEILKTTNEEYVQLQLQTSVEGRPIISGPQYHTSGISKMLHFIMQPVLEKVRHILKDTFDFVERFDKSWSEGEHVVTWDIKSLYPNIRHDLFYEAMSYWIDKFSNELPLLRRFSKEFILEGLSIILEFNYAYFDKHFYHQIKGTATGTTFSVVGANLVVAFKEVSLFRRLPDLYPADFVDYFIRNYFRFLDDICHKWLSQFDIRAFSEAINELDPDLKFLMDAIMAENHFLDVSISVQDGVLEFDIHHKPTNAFGYLRYTSCHPPHTKKNIAKSLGKRIVRIVSHNRDKRLAELRDHLEDRGHPRKVINDSLSTLFQPDKHNEGEELIPFVHTFNPNHRFDRNRIKFVARRSNNQKIRAIFKDCNVVMATKQPKNLKKMLTRAKFELIPSIVPHKPAGLYPCGKCTYCARGYIIPATEFSIQTSAGRISWTYTRHFTCNSKNVLYIVKNDFDINVYLGKTNVVKSRVGKHISDIFHPENSNCKKCCRHLGNVSGMVEPFFRYFPFFYVDDPGLRDFMEKRFIRRWRPQLNAYNVAY